MWWRHHTSAILIVLCYPNARYCSLIRMNRGVSTCCYVCNVCMYYIKSYIRYVCIVYSGTSPLGTLRDLDFCPYYRGFLNSEVTQYTTVLHQDTEWCPYYRGFFYSEVCIREVPLCTYIHMYLCICTDACFAVGCSEGSLYVFCAKDDSSFDVMALIDSTSTDLIPVSHLLWSHKMSERKGDDKSLLLFSKGSYIGAGKIGSGNRNPSSITFATGIHSLPITGECCYVQRAPSHCLLYVDLSEAASSVHFQRYLLTLFRHHQTMQFACCVCLILGSILHESTYTYVHRAYLRTYVYVRMCVHVHGRKKHPGW